jgi:hypothetical protein
MLSFYLLGRVRVSQPSQEAKHLLELKGCWAAKIESCSPCCLVADSSSGNISIIAAGEFYPDGFGALTYTTSPLTDLLGVTTDRIANATFRNTLRTCRTGTLGAPCSGLLESMTYDRTHGGGFRNPAGNGIALIESIVDSPKDILQPLADTICGMPGCGSAGISLLRVRTQQLLMESHVFENQKSFDIPSQTASHSDSSRIASFPSAFKETCSNVSLGFSKTRIVELVGDLGRSVRQSGGFTFLRFCFCFGCHS